MFFLKNKEPSLPATCMSRMAATRALSKFLDSGSTMLYKWQILDQKIPSSPLFLCFRTARYEPLLISWLSHTQKKSLTFPNVLLFLVSAITQKNSSIQFFWFPFLEQCFTARWGNVRTSILILIFLSMTLFPSEFLFLWWVLGGHGLCQLQAGKVPFPAAT